jgi:hypothetical protein
VRPRDVEQVRDAAEAVRRQAEGVELAFAEERAANEAALRAVLEAAEPALEALSSRLLGFRGYGDFRGVPLSSAGPGLIQGATGRRLYARPDGILVEAIFAGAQAVACGVVDAEDASSRYRAEDVAAELLAAMARQLDGNAPRRAQDARRRAARLRAIATLVEAVCEPGGRR